VALGMALGTGLTPQVAAQAIRSVAAGPSFSCANWQGAHRHVMAGESIEAHAGDRAHHLQAIAHYKVALSVCRDYPWAYGDLQQSYGDLHSFAQAAHYGWQAVDVARRTRGNWAWSATQYRAFLASCFDNLGWGEQMLADAVGPAARAYRTHLTAALADYHSALLYDARDTYANHHAATIQRYLRSTPAA
jgi:hypothetical protein